MYAFCTEELGYSEDEAYLRVQAMRCMKEVPQIEERIESGRLSLTVVAKALNIFRKMAKEKKPLAIGEKQEIMDMLLDKSVRQAEKKLAFCFPEEQIPREKIKPITDTLTRIEFNANQDFMNKLEKLKAAFAHKNFSGRLDLLFEQTMDIALKKLEKPAAKHPVSPQLNRTRYIPRQTVSLLKNRAKVRCEYVSPHTGKRCTSNHGLQIDHIHEYSRGGGNELKNLQILCGAHNRWKSIVHKDMP